VPDKVENGAADDAHHVRDAPVHGVDISDEAVEHSTVLLLVPPQAAVAQHLEGTQEELPSRQDAAPDLQPETGEVAKAEGDHEPGIDTEVADVGPAILAEGQTADAHELLVRTIICPEGQPHVTELLEDHDAQDGCEDHDHATPAHGLGVVPVDVHLHVPRLPLLLADQGLRRLRC